MTRPDMDAIKTWAGDEAAWCRKQDIPDHAGLRHVRTLLAYVAELEALLAGRVEEAADLKRQVAVQRNAYKTGLNASASIYRHLQEIDRSEYVAAQTLDSERNANALLTKRVEELEAGAALLINAIASIDPDGSGMGAAYNVSQEVMKLLELPDNEERT